MATACLAKAADPATTDQPAIATKSADHAIVSGFDRFYDAANSSAVDGGLLLLGELNCIGCHSAPTAAEDLILKKQSPYLGQIAQRADPKFIQRFLTSTHTVKPGTTMPSVLSNLTPAEAEAAAINLTHYLASLAKTPFQRVPPDMLSITRGEAAFHAVGCVACHAPRQSRQASTNSQPVDEDEVQQRAPVDLNSSSIPLSRKLHEKYSLTGLSGFLANPLLLRPSGRMPHLNLTAAEATDIAQYLLKDTVAPAPLNLAVYEGDWDMLPDFDKLKPKATGTANGFELAGFKGRDKFALRFTGYLRIETAGEYTFVTSSDDGTKLYIDDQLVVDNDGIHPPKEDGETKQLTAGLHAIKVDYFEAGGGEELAVTWKGPGFKRQPISSSLLSSTNQPTAEQTAWQVDAALASKGQAAFTSLGCANCHQLNAQDRKPQAVALAKSLAELKPTGGCLASQPEAKHPYFQLNARQIATLSAAITAIQTKQLPSRKPTDVIHTKLTTLNCYACHQRGDIGGVIRERDAYFTANQPDLGDEGRLPPILTGVGDKLLPKALNAVLTKAAVARPYVDTRMPQYGEANLGQLAEQLIKQDLVESSVPVIIDKPQDLKKHGQKLVGKEALTCVSCHMFNGTRSLGIQAMDLTLMHDRLRPEWFHRYMLNPAEYRPGTRMPQSFINGKSTYVKIFDGEAPRQLTAIWTFLSEGRKAKYPDGVIPQGMELVVGTEAVIYRNFITDAGPRAIGVGYAEDVNLAFDANQQRIALLWLGKFMDGSRHWEGRGQGFQPPLGEQVVNLPQGPTWALLASNQTAWPKGAEKNHRDPLFQFHGYQLDELRRPTFQYDLRVDQQVISIRDFPMALQNENQRSLRRTFTITSTTETTQLYARLAQGKLEKTDAGYRAGELEIIIKSAETPVLRGTGDQQELLVPVPVTAKQPSELQVEYRW